MTSTAAPAHPPRLLRHLLPGDLQPDGARRRTVRDWAVDVALFFAAVIIGLSVYDLESAGRPVSELVRLADLVAGVVLCVALIFKYVPHARVRFGDVWPGAIATGLLWRGALAAFSWYARDLARWSVHGSIASVVVFLLWVYVLVVILLYGVQMTAAYARLRDGEQTELGL